MLNVRTIIFLELSFYQELCNPSPFFTSYMYNVYKCMNLTHLHALWSFLLVFFSCGTFFVTLDVRDAVELQQKRERIKRLTFLLSLMWHKDPLCITLYYTWGTKTYDIVTLLQILQLEYNECQNVSQNSNKCSWLLLAFHQYQHYLLQQ